MTDARIRAADHEPGNWMAPGRTYDEQRFSPLRQINSANVGRLGLAWYADLHTFRGLESNPVVVDGVLYNIAPWNIVTAYEARTGRVLWSFDPQVPPETGRSACCDIVTRGLSVWRGHVIIATLDGRLISVDAATGKPAWTANTFEGEPPWSYTITGAPRVFDGKVVIGNAGGEYGVRGYVSAYDADTGKKLWRFYTVPGDPSKGFENEALRRAAHTWTGEWWKSGGGGTVWDGIVYDPQLRLLYFGTSNGYRGPAASDNLFLASILAVKLDTGEYAWHFQETPADIWDYDATAPLMLATLRWHGRLRKVLMQAPKNGFFYILDPADGKLLSATPLVPTTWASGIDPVTGRPAVNPVARYAEKPVLVSPGAGGAHNFNPFSYSPATGLVYLPLERSFTIFSTLGFAPVGYEKERAQLAAYAAANERSWLAAWDPVRGQMKWRVQYRQGGSGGTLATAGNLVFQGTIEKKFAAYRATDGERLWQAEVQTVPIAAPMTYMVESEQYVAINAGWGGGRAHVQSTSFQELHVSAARLLVFRLGGTAELPPLAHENEAPPAPPPLMNPPPPADMQRGAQLYAKHCAMCHGAQARGGIKDLRHMSEETHAHFLDIVLGGIRQKAGMASFADVLSRADAELIHDYLILRANDDWGQEQSRAH